MAIYLYEEDSGEEREITSDSIEDALSQARVILAEGVERQFAAIRKQGRYMDVTEATVTADVTQELPDTTLDVDSRQSIEVTLPVPADIYRA